MRKVCKIVFCAVVILLLGVFNQQETKAGEANERHYSRTYSVLSANVGNSSDIRGLVQAELVKLQPNSDEEKRVMSEIKDLKPDILILIEAYNYIQARYICSSTGESYSIHGGPPLDFTVHDGPYDFVCVKNEIIAKEQDIKEDQMPEDGSYEKYKGNSVGYVDVGLKGEEGRKVRLFYVHFPSYQGVWTPAKHKIHRDAFDWISRNLSVPIPCLIAGDLNNDFTRGKSQIDNEAAFITNPLLAKKYREEQEKTHSSLYIEKQVNDLKLWIFNPLAQPLQLQFLDGSTKHGYEATWRIPPEIVWKTTIDWVMGKFCVPPFLAPGGPKTDLVTGTTGTIRTNFVTSPPDWWKDKSVVDTSRFTFDHKPLYGKVVFFWEDRVQSDVKGWKEYKLGDASFSVPSDWRVTYKTEDCLTVASLGGGWEDKRYVTFSVGVVAGPKDMEAGKYDIVYYGRDGGQVGDLKTTSYSVTFRGRIVDSFKTEVADRQVPVGVVRYNMKSEAIDHPRIKRERIDLDLTMWGFVIIKDRKLYVFDLTGRDPAYLNGIFEQLIPRIHFLPKVN